MSDGKEPLIAPEGRYERDKTFIRIGVMGSLMLFFLYLLKDYKNDNFLLSKADSTSSASPAPSSLAPVTFTPGTSPPVVQATPQPSAPDTLVPASLAPSTPPPSVPPSVFPTSTTTECRLGFEYEYEPYECMSNVSILPRTACEPRHFEHLQSICNVKGEETTEPRCFLQGEGRILAKRVRDCSRQHGAGLPQCTRGDVVGSLAKVGEKDNGRFSRRKLERGFEVVLDECSLKEYRRDDLLDLWGGKRVLISGDGAARQMFIKLVHILRGMEWGVVMEHSGPIDYYYATGLEDDVLQPWIPEDNALPLADPVLEVIFRYEEGPVSYNMESERVDVHIAVLSEWGEVENKGRDAYATQAKAHAKKAAGRGFKLVLVTGPFSADGESKQLDRLAERMMQHAGRNVLALSAAQFARLQYFRPTRPGRYMCSTVLPFPAPVGSGTAKMLKELKRNGVLCRDHFNREWWKLLLNAMGHEGAELERGEVCRKEQDVALGWGGTCAHANAKLPDLACDPESPPSMQSYCQYPENCFAVGDGIQAVSEVTRCREAPVRAKCNWDSITKDLAAVTREDNGPFSWRRTARGQEVRSASCDLEEYTREQIITLFRGKRVLISGDSLMRQLFKKFVNIMRGRMWDYNFEYKGHASFLYAMNETHDKFIVQPGLGTEPIVANQLFEVEFSWDPLPLAGFNRKKIEKRGVPDLHLASVGVWWRKEQGQEEESHDTYMKEAMEYAREHAADGYQYVFLPGPVLASQRGKKEPNDAYRVEWLERLGRMVTEPNTRTLSVTSYSKLGYFPATDGVHYMCGATEFIPKKVSEESVRSVVRMAGRHSCFENYNANLWTILFNALDGVV